MSRIVLAVVFSLLVASETLAQWERITSPGGQAVYSMLASNGKLYASSNTGFYLSTNSGLDWTRKDTVNYQFQTLLEYNGRIYGGYIYGVLRSSDDGSTWSYVSGGSIHELVYRLFQFRGNLYAGVQSVAGGSSPGVYESTNGGTAWVPRGTFLPTNASIGSFASIDTLLFVVAWDTTNVRTLYRSFNGGLLWVPLTLPPGGNLTEMGANQTRLFCNLASSGFNGGYMAVSADRGNTWSLHPDLGGHNVSNVTSFVSVDSVIFFSLAGSGFSTEIRAMRSTDNGESFVSFVDGLPRADSLGSGQQVFASSTHLFYRTGGNGLWRRQYQTTDVRGQLTPQMPREFELEQNFPNPFNPATEIRYQVAEFNHATLRVYNVLGQEVATLVNGQLNPGAYSVQFDPRGLAGGVYLYRLQSGHNIDVKKLLLLK